MKHPLLVAMLTPQAAPETRGLRIMRLVWMALCASLAGAVLGLQVLLALLGPKGALVAAALCLAAPIHGLFYFRAKIRADEAFERGEGA